MIILNLKGGLGNQLFQLGAALRAAKGDHKEIFLYDNQLKLEQKKYIPKLFEGLEFNYLSIADISDYLLKSDFRMVGDTDRGPHFDQTLLDLDFQSQNINVFLNGYFQSNRNLYSLKSFIASNKEKLEFFNHISSQSNENILIHYRLGDYVRIDVQKEIGLINLSYVDDIIAKLYDGKRMFVIYSDGDLLAKKYTLNNIHHKIGGDDLQVFQELMTARILVIPNSTFSLSAGLLSECLTELYRPQFWSRKYLADQLSDIISVKVHYISNSFYKV